MELIKLTKLPMNIINLVEDYLPRMYERKNYLSYNILPIIENPSRQIGLILNEDEKFEPCLNCFLYGKFEEFGSIDGLCQNCTYEQSIQIDNLKYSDYQKCINTIDKYLPYYIFNYWSSTIENLDIFNSHYLNLKKNIQIKNCK